MNTAQVIYQHYKALPKRVRAELIDLIITDYDSLTVEDLEDIQLYDKAKKQSKGKSEDANTVFDRLLNHVEV